MKRNGLSLRWKIYIAQNDPNKLIDQLVWFVLQVCQLSSKYHYQPAEIIAMDENHFQADMVKDTTVDVTRTNTVTVKTSGQHALQLKQTALN